LKKQVKRIFFLAVLVCSVWLGGLLADLYTLQQDILRLHVVANSDSDADQDVKLQVRDAILGSLEQGLAQARDVEEAKMYIRSVLPELEQIANETLSKAGFTESAVVSLEQEAFPVRDYDTFRLPSGVYQSLRVRIGDAEGKNWWCVVFPELCMSATTNEFAEVAAMEGIPDRLSGSLTGEYEIRFWILDQLGRLGNFLRGERE